MGILEEAEVVEDRDRVVDRVAVQDPVLGREVIVCVQVVATKNRIRSGNDVWIYPVRSAAQK